jgi:peptide/nickel transport system substrate-binding protein
MRRTLALTVLVLAAVCAAALLPAVAAAESPSASPAAESLIFKVGIGEDVDGVNPFRDYSSITWEAFRINYNFLTWYDENYKPTPDLAKSWNSSPDGKVWTFNIRKGVKWHDGTPMTARDIAFTYNYIIDNELWMYIQYFEHVTKVEATDDTTLVITSDRPNAGMLALYVPILPEHLWSKIPPAKADKIQDPPTVGTGPFMFNEVKKSKYVSMKANKEYFEGAPKIDEVYFQIYQSGDTLVQDYKAGHLDVAVFESPTFLRSVEGMPGSKGVAVSRIGFHQLGFNTWTSPKSKGNPLLRDVRIRQSVHWAIDKEKINAQSMDGLATVGTGVISPAAGDWHWQPTAAEAVTYDPAKAKQILEDAGYKDADGDGIRETADGTKLSWRFDVMSAYQNDITAGKMIAQWLKEVGIDAKLNIADEGAFGDRVYDNADMDMFIWSWGGDIDPGFMLSCFTTTQILNWSDSEYSNPVYDDLFKQQAAAVDRAQRVEIVHQMQKLLYDEAPYIILWYNLDVQAYRTDKWTGWQLVPPKGEGRPVWTFLRGTYQNVKPAAVVSQTSTGLSTGAIAGISAAAVVVLGLAVWLVLRRRGGGKDRAEEI